jgi:hypothetical protein
MKTLSVSLSDEGYRNAALHAGFDYCMKAKGSEICCNYCKRDHRKSNSGEDHRKARAIFCTRKAACFILPQALRLVDSLNLGEAASASWSSEEDPSLDMDILKKLGAKCENSPYVGGRRRLRLLQAGRTSSSDFPRA